MKRNRVSAGVLSACVVAAWLGLAGQAYGQGLHGVTIAKGCVSPLCVGEMTSCDIQLGYNDEFGDTIRILSAWDVQDFGGDNVRVPDTGDLPIVAVGGNTTCAVGGALPCMIGPGGSTLSGLPGDPEPGFVRFRQDTYEVQSDDPDTLSDQATVEWEDLCDDPETSGCGVGVVNPAPAPASTMITRCDDEDACTTDTCEAGVCTFAERECDDNDACTTNACVLGTCVFTAIPCDDGDGCTEDVCDTETGECVSTPNFSCDDEDACTEDACDPATGGCIFTPVVTCDDGDECTVDTCNSTTGECEFTPGDACDDGDDCTEDTCDVATGACVFTPIDPPPPGCGAGDGCTPGFWKQPHHSMYWVGFGPDDSFNTVFSVDGTGEKTLREATWSRGGGESALMRHAVAALLNASSDEVNYLYTVDEVIAMVQDAYATGDFNETKDMFEEENERGCTVDKSGQKQASHLRRMRGR